MPIIILQHDETCGPGRLGLTFRDHGKLVDLRRLDLPTEALGGPKGNRHVPIDFDGVEGVVSMGGHMNVGDDYPWMKDELAFLREAHARRIPLVGVCLGHQLIAKALGGEVGPMSNAAGAPAGELGMCVVKQHPVANTDTVLAGIAWTQRQFQSHMQEVKSPPPGATVLQYSDVCKVQSFRVGLRTYGFQYHFECDGPMIDSLLTHGGECCAAAGKLMDEVREGVRRHYDEYARLSDRLGANIASFLMPVTRRFVA